jgi:hypothetical protein
MGIISRNADALIRLNARKVILVNKLSSWISQVEEIKYG